jgi:hypothetical protein
MGEEKSWKIKDLGATSTTFYCNDILERMDNDVEGKTITRCSHEFSRNSENNCLGNYKLM